jgi:hypothetical protein
MRCEIYVRLFCGEAGARNPKKKRSEGPAEPKTDEPACRFCHNPGELVCPCECKGSSQYVHLQCLQQWQKSVLLSQSTHPDYQTKIDEICNVCGTPFRFKGKTRRQQIMEYTGAELAARIRPGNLFCTH